MQSFIHGTAIIRWKKLPSHPSNNCHMECAKQKDAVVNHSCHGVMTVASFQPYGWWAAVTLVIGAVTDMRVLAPDVTVAGSAKSLTLACLLSWLFQRHNEKTETSIHGRDSITLCGTPHTLPTSATYSAIKRIQHVWLLIKYWLKIKDRLFRLCFSHCLQVGLCCAHSIYLAIHVHKLNGPASRKLRMRRLDGEHVVYSVHPGWSE